MPQPEAVKLDF